MNSHFGRYLDAKVLVAIKKVIAIAANLDCLIFLGLGMRIAGGMANRPTSFKAYMSHPPEFWTAMYLAAAASGYFCLVLARYRGRTDLWRIWSLCIAAPLFAFSTCQFFSLTSSPATSTYGALWVVRLLKSFGLYESDVLIKRKR